MSLQRIRIQNELVNQAKTFASFHPVTVNPDTKLYAANEALSINPAEALAHEVSASFDEAVRNRRSDLRERTRWIFELRIKFNQEVVCEKFEKHLCSKIKLLRDAAGGLDQQVTLLLVDASYQQSVQQQGTSGTWVVYTFEAHLSPI